MQAIRWHVYHFGEGCAHLCAHQALCMHAADRMQNLDNGIAAAALPASWPRSLHTQDTHLPTCSNEPRATSYQVSERSMLATQSCRDSVRNAASVSHLAPHVIVRTGIISLLFHTRSTASRPQVRYLSKAGTSTTLFTTSLCAGLCVALPKSCKCCAVHHLARACICHKSASTHQHIQRFVCACELTYAARDVAVQASAWQQGGSTHVGRASSYPTPPRGLLIVAKTCSSAWCAHNCRRLLCSCMLYMQQSLTGHHRATTETSRCMAMIHGQQPTLLHWIPATVFIASVCAGSHREFFPVYSSTSI